MLTYTHFLSVQDWVYSTALHSKAWNNQILSHICIF